MSPSDAAGLAGTVLGAALALAAAYALWLARARPPAPPAADSGGAWPPVDVVVAVYNERRLLPGKLENLAQLEYPGPPLRFIVVDGASIDGSADLARAWALRDGRFLVLDAPRPGKAVQINVALQHAQAPWVVVTDADARLRSDTLTRLMAAAALDPGLGVVGSPVMPLHVHPVEQLHWRVLNWLRRQEWRRGSASMVMAPCYAFRRELIESLPEDVVGDDVHVAWRVGSRGHRIGLAGPVVQEVRGPATVQGLFRQKVRRGAAILREVFRFLPAAGRMTPALRVAFLARTAVFVAAPLAVSLAGLLAGALLAWLPTLHGGITLALVAIGGVLALRPLERSRVRRPLALAALLTLAAAVSLLLYPLLGGRGARTAWRLPERP